ncbi:NAD-dependent epimerase/dehydratase family protein [Fundidesulfovibrio terrae]|uniref:NAD-dependent epimerase/dehydratase family protein n=1 Tax=Fundidesulfovibrio terrae TaxID=2922866 RepID=UPI001FB00201|nr:NAD-dependent epimerase/dehydratase family protein [Fundidesulfovibrio terrae]
MRALVTGGLGFIGSHLTDALIEKGLDVAVLDNLEYQVHRGSYPAYANPKAVTIIGDVRNQGLLANALDGVEVIFHQAARVGVGQSMYEPVRYVESNCLGTAAILDHLANRRHCVRKVVVASSMSCYGEGSYLCPGCGGSKVAARTQTQLEAKNYEMVCAACGQAARPVPTREDHPMRPDSVYAVTKRDQEEMCLSFGRHSPVPAVALRYFNGYGTRQSLSNPYTGVCAIFCSRLKNGQPPLIFEDGLQMRDFVHVSDIVQANILAMENPDMDNRAFNVGSGNPLTVLDLARTIGRVIGSDVEPQVTGQFRAGDIRHCFGDCSAITAMGYKPAMSLEEGIARLTSWAEGENAHDMVDKAWDELRKHRLVR